MPIITEPKKLSMPQQVQKNKEDIESILKIIDGLDATDNVVVVPDMSYILSADELKSVRQPVAFIVYNNNVYLKRKEESNTAYFDRVFSIVFSTVITFNSEEIVVDLTNGALGNNSVSVNTYSVSQIDTKFATIAYVDSVLASKANLSGANFTGNITAPSIIENMPNTYRFFNEASTTDFEITFNYAGVVKNGNKLTFAINAKIKKLTTTETGYIGEFQIPAVIGQRLYPATLGEFSYLDQKNVSLFSSPTASIDIPVRMTKQSNYQLRVYIYPVNMVINTEYIFRYEVTFLLSDNLAQ